MKKRLKINGVIMFLAVVLVLVFPKIFFRQSQAVFWDGLATIGGMALILLGQILRASSRGYKAANSQNGCSLIEQGPYTLVRNPMYLGILLIGIGVLLALFNFWALVIFLCVFIARYILLIFKEEKKLVTVFGQAYQDYQQRVPRLIPAWDALCKKDIAEYLPLKTPWLKKEIGSILAVLFVVFLIEGWNGALSIGLSMYLRKTVLTLSVIIVFAGLIIYLLKKTGER